MFGNLISIPQVSGVSPDLGVNQESVKRIVYPIWCQNASGTRGRPEGDVMGVGVSEQMQVVEKPSNRKRIKGRSFLGDYFKNDETIKNNVAVWLADSSTHQSLLIKLVLASMHFVFFSGHLLASIIL